MRSLRSAILSCLCLLAASGLTGCVTTLGSAPVVRLVVDRPTGNVVAVPTVPRPLKKTLRPLTPAERLRLAAWFHGLQVNAWYTAWENAHGGLPIRGDYHSWPDWPLWHAVGLCEQSLSAGEPDPWGDGIAWAGTSRGGTVGSSYPGGLGESRDFWDTYRGPAGVTVPNGAEATPAEQIRVAREGSRYGTRMGGWSSWPGCVHAHGG